MASQAELPLSEALARREAELRRIHELANVVPLEIDVRDGLTGYRDPAFLKLHGLPPDRHTETHAEWLERLHPEDRARAEQVLLAALEGSAGTYDNLYRIVRPPDGQVRWIHARGAIERDGEGRPLRILGVHMDVTEQKQTELAMRENQEGLRMALEAGRMGTYRFDVRTGIETWSDSEYELLGLRRTAEPPTRELFLSVVHPDDLHLVEFTQDDRRPPGTSLDSEFRIIRPDTGEVRYLTAHALARFGPDGRPIEVIGVNQDVTEERRVQAALRVSEDRLQQFSEASPAVLWIRDAKSLQWEYLSPAFERIYGLSRQDALKADNFRSWLDFVVPEDREQARAAIGKVVAGERGTFEYRIRRPDGQVRWLRDADFPIRNHAGIVTHVAGVGSDVTALREAAEHQRVLLAELQHRVRNTLGIVRSIARRTAATSLSVEDYAMKLEGRIDAFARVQSAVTRDPQRGIDLGMLVAEEMRAASVREGEGLSIEGPPVRLNARAAETFALAVHELVTNAIKYGALTVPNGRIAIAWRLGGEAGAAERLVFTWRESGLAHLPPPMRRGLGTEILQKTLPYELGALTTLDYLETGLNCTIELPLGAILLQV